MPHAVVPTGTLTDMRDLDVDRMFAATWGVFTPRMAYDAGITRAMLRHRRRLGAWVSVCGDGISAAEGEATPNRRAIAAHLTWPDAIVCLRTAARLHRLPVDDDGAAHVLVADSRRPREGIRTHYYRHGPITHRYGDVPITDKVSTIVDCLALLPEREAYSLLAWVRTRELLSVDALTDQIRGRFRMAGVVRLRRMLEDAAEGALSVGERRLQQLLRDAGLTGWKGDVRIEHAGTVIARADILFRAEHLVVEFDGVAFHGPEKVADDLRRQNRLVVAGYTVLRFTWEDITERPDDVVRTIRASLEIVRRSGRSA